LPPLYTMRQNDQGEIYFVVDGSDPDPIRIGKVYSDPGPALAVNIATMREVVVEPDFYTNEWGTFLSAYAPIHRSDGQLDGVLAIDMPADNVLEEERRFLIVSLIVFACIIPISLIIARLIARALIRPILMIRDGSKQIALTDLPHLSEVARVVAAGDLTRTTRIEVQPINYHANDELGEMAAAQNQTIASLQETSRAISDMTQNTQQMAETNSKINTASQKLASASIQSEEATSQIVAVMQKFSLGVVQQNASILNAAASLEKMVVAIQKMTSGAQKQTLAVNEATEISRQAAEIAHNGAGIVESTIQGIHSIPASVSKTRPKLR
jgi:methyl-accepting chemotaxis protein